MGKTTSPLTGGDIGRSAQLVPNHAVRKAIAELGLGLPSAAEVEGACGFEVTTTRSHTYAQAHTDTNTHTHAYTRLHKHL